MAGTLLWKGIKAQRMQLDKDFQREVRNAVLRVGRAVVKEYEKTTKTWDDKPRFEFVRDLSSSSAVSIYVGTNDRIFNMVDEGTKGDYLILPSHKARIRVSGRSVVRSKSGGIVSSTPMLVYQVDFISKSVPNKLISRGGGKFGAWTFRPFTIHPGVEARNFSKEVAKDYQPRFKAELEQVIRDFARSSGHGA